MSVKTVTVLGSTGLIGKHLVDQLQNDPAVETVRVIVRRPVQINNPKVEMKLVNFTDPESLKLAIDGSDAVFCAIGTTQKKVKGDKDAYRKVDFDIPVNAARFCAETGCTKFLIVSSVGANPKSGNFYLRLKGEVEEAVRQQAISQTVIFRPSILLGNRKESRPGEKIGQVVMQLFSPLFIGAFKKYKPVHAKDIAVAMIKEAKSGRPGYQVYEYPF